MGGQSSTIVRATIALLVILLASPLAVAWTRTSGGEPVNGQPGIAGFRHSAETDRETYEKSETVVLTYRVCRSRPWPTTTNPAWPDRSLTAAFRVVSAQGEVVADTTHRGGILSMARPPRWWPGQCRSVDFEWDQHLWNQPDFEDPDVAGEPVRGDRVEPGNYRFEVWWLASRGEPPDDEASKPVETPPFLIEP